jgi:hypothetical protein
VKLIQHIVEERIEEHVAGVACNVCGRFLDLHREEKTSIDLQGGDHSTYPGDLWHVSFDVCDACMKAWVATFVIKPPVVSHTSAVAMHAITGVLYDVPLGCFGLWIFSCEELFEGRMRTGVALDALVEKWERLYGDMADATPEWGTVWRHEKTGNKYIVLGCGFTSDEVMHVHYRRLYDKPVVVSQWDVHGDAYSSDRIHPWSEWREKFTLV